MYIKSSTLTIFLAVYTRLLKKYLYFYNGSSLSEYIFEARFLKLFILVSFQSRNNHFHDVLQKYVIFIIESQVTVIETTHGLLFIIHNHFLVIFDWLFYFFIFCMIGNLWPNTTQISTVQDVYTEIIMYP